MAYLGPMLINKMIVPMVLISFWFVLRKFVTINFEIQQIKRSSCKIFCIKEYYMMQIIPPKVCFKMLCLHDSESLKAKSNEVHLQVLFFNYNAISHWFELESQ